MRQHTFGRRSAPPGRDALRTDGKYSRIDFVRGVAAGIIHHYRNGSAAEKDGLAMRVLILQDQIAALKRLTATPPRATELDWVDSWRPD